MSRAGQPYVLALGAAVLLAGCTLVTDSSQFLVDAAGRDAGPPPDRDAGPPTARDSGPDAMTGEDGGPPVDGGDGPPRVVYISGTVPDSGTSSLSRHEFGFVADPSATGDAFECQLESVTASGSASTGFTACTSPFSVELLEAGAHTLSVRAMGASTGFGPPAVRSFTVEAVATDIPTIQRGVDDGSFTLETLVTVTARVQRDIPAGGAFSREVVLADAGGSTLAAVSWHGIFSQPRDPTEATFAAGVEVTVTGTVRELDGNTEIVGATYARGTTRAPYSFYGTRNATELSMEALEGLVIDVAGGVPTNFNCTACIGSPSGPYCLETCEGGCRPLRHRNLTGDRDYGRDGFYTSALRQAGAGRPELWVTDFVDQSDACL